MSKIIKNISNQNKIWGGFTIESMQSYTCANDSEASRFARDDNFILSLTSNEAQVYNATALISGVSNSITFLMGDLVDSDGARLVRSRAFANSDGFRFRGHSMTGTVANNQTSDIEYHITQERYINGGRLIVDNVGVNDKITFQVVDKDNIFGLGAGVILDQFITDYYIPQSVPLEVRLDYPARIVAGLYLRLKYTSTHASGCNVKCNLYLHWKAT